MEQLRPQLTELIDDPLLYLGDERAEMRRLAASILGRRSNEAPIAAALVELLASDAEPSVRAAAAEALGLSSDVSALLGHVGDESADVREAIAFAAGEIGDRQATKWLMDAAQSDSDDAVREATVAALGSIGDDDALPLLIELADRASPKVRRRAVVALSAFESDDALAAIRKALGDRNPMVREVAEMVVGGGQVEDLPFPTRKP